MITECIDPTKYPLEHPTSGEYRDLISRLQATLESDRLVNVEGFLTSGATERIADEIDARAHDAFRSKRMGNPYGVPPQDELAEDHPCRILSPTDRFGLARHQLHGTLLEALYCWDPLRRFVGDVIGLDEVYLHEDPSNALVVQMYRSGGGLAWHFDNAHFSTILNIREAESGGTFECVPDLRSEDDPRFDDVRDVLLDRSDRVERHDVKAGSFTIMAGRYALHRVTENTGSSSRLSAVLSYEAEPGVKLDAAKRRLFFGPTAPAD